MKKLYWVKHYVQFVGEAFVYADSSEEAEEIAHECGLKATEYVDDTYLSAPVDLSDREHVRDSDILNPEDKPE